MLIPLLLAGLGIVAAVGVFLGLLMVRGDPVGQPAKFDLAARSPTLTVIAADPEDELGRVAVGDFNGDGTGDLLVGAPRADGPNNSRFDAGEAYVILGGKTGVLDIGQGQQEVTIFGADPGDSLGRFLAAADLNNDGHDDIIISSAADGPGNSRPDAGETYVIFGSPSLPATVDVSAGQQSLTLAGADPGDDLGKSIASGDLNNDGRDDLIIGADSAFGPNNSRPAGGEAYVIFGRSGLSGNIDISSSQQDVTIYGAEPGDDLGQAVASGDVNGDGVSDLVITADDANGPNNSRGQAGELYVIYGPLAGKTVDVAAGQQDVTVFGADAGDNLSKDISVGDVNGDGRADIVMGVSLADGPNNARFKAGELYVVFGAANLSGSVDIRAGQQNVTVLGADGGDQLGQALTAERSLNGDNTADILTGANNAGGPGNGRNKAGEAYVAFGSSALAAEIDLAQGDQPMTIYGADANDVLGSYVATGDVTGDGQADIVVGAPRGSGPDNKRSKAGEVYVIAAGDADADGLLTSLDNCPTVSNADQVDTDADGAGDACQSDSGSTAPGGGAGASRGGSGSGQAGVGETLPGPPGSGVGSLAADGSGLPLWAATAAVITGAGLLGLGITATRLRRRQ